MSRTDLYFIWGEEAYLIDREISSIRTRMAEQNGEEVELVFLDAEELGPEGLMENLEFSSLFSQQRLVVIRRPPWLGKSRRKSARVQEIKTALENYLGQNHIGQTLIITAEGHDGSNALVRWLDKEATVVQCKTPGAQYLAGWVREQMSARGCSVSEEGARLVARSGRDMYYLENLIEKLSLAGADGKIALTDLADQVENKAEIKIFELTDALMDRKTHAAFNAFHQLLEQGEHPLFFLYMIVRQFLGLGKIKYYQEKGYRQEAIAEATGMKEFVVRKMTGRARNFSWSELKHLFDLFLQTDISLKTTGLDEVLLMETLLVEVCQRQ